VVALEGSALWGNTLATALLHGQNWTIPFGLIVLYHIFKLLKTIISPVPPCDAVRKQKKNILEDLFSSVLTQFKKYHPLGNLKCNYLGIFQSFKMRISMEKILSISLKLNFITNTLGCYGLSI